jgi:hypothetical protein
MPRKNYRADATAIGGFLERPIARSLPVQSATSLAPSGGEGEVSSTNFQFERIISAVATRSRVEGRSVRGLLTTRAMAAVEDLNVLDVIRAEELVAYVSTEHSGEQLAGPRVDLGGALISGLRIGDSVLRVHLDLNLLSNGNRFPSQPHFFQKGLWNKVSQKFDPDGRFLQCSLVKAIEVIRGELPGRVVGPNVIEIPNFGRVYLAELLLSRDVYELTMVGFELGPTVIGDISIAAVRVGSPFGTAVSEYLKTSSDKVVGEIATIHKSFDVSRSESLKMSQQERTATFIRLLKATALERPIIGDDVLRKIEDSETPLNPLDQSDEDYCSPEDRFAFGAAFRRLLERGINWTPIQDAASHLRKELAVQKSNRLKAEEQTRWLPTTVPIIVDDIRAGGLVRLNYLCVETDAPKPGWALNISDSSLPFLLLGLAGVILHPFDALVFDTPLRIENLFQTLEERLGFDVAIGNVWLPNSIFKEKADPGSVFRVDSSLFQRAYSLREMSVNIGTDALDFSWSSLFDQLRNLPPPQFSTLETEAFSQWSERQIADASEPGRKNALGEGEL